MVSPCSCLERFGRSESGFHQFLNFIVHSETRKYVAVAVVCTDHHFHARLKGRSRNFQPLKILNRLSEQVLFCGKGLSWNPAGNLLVIDSPTARNNPISHMEN